MECRLAYHEKNTQRCLQCNEPVAPEKGKFSGEFFELEDGKGRIHSECYDAYEEATADRCLVCEKAVRRMEGFSGDFMVVEGGKKVHKVGGWKVERRTGPALSRAYGYCTELVFSTATAVTSCF